MLINRTYRNWQNYDISVNSSWISRTDAVFPEPELDTSSSSSSSAGYYGSYYICGDLSPNAEGEYIYDGFGKPHPESPVWGMLFVPDFDYWQLNDTYYLAIIIAMGQPISVIFDFDNEDYTCHQWQQAIPTYSLIGTYNPISYSCPTSGVATVSLSPCSSYSSSSSCSSSSSSSSSTEIKTSSSSSESSQDLIPSYLHYKMNDNAASTLVTDSMSNANGASIQNTSLISVPGIINDALSFNGVSDIITIASSTPIKNIFNGLNPMSVAFWAQLNNDSGRYNIITTKGSDNNVVGVFQIQISVGETTQNISVGFKEDSEHVLSVTTTTACDGNWHHYVIVYDGSNTVASSAIRIFMDDIDRLAQSDYGTAPLLNGVVNDEPLLIGCGNYDFDNGIEHVYFVNGNIDDFRVYDNQLTQSMIDKLYNNGNGTEA